MPRVSITIPGENSQPYRFGLDKETITLGRGSENDIVIDCPSVSSKHCIIERISGGYILRDNQSTNGLRLGDEYMHIVDLTNESKIRVGDVRFEYELSTDELDELDEEQYTPKQETLEDYEKRHSKPENETLKRKMVVSSAQPKPPLPAPQILASSTQGSGFLYGLSLTICGCLALYAGLNLSYTTHQSNLRGRAKGEFTLLSDINEGRPPASEEVQEK